MFLCIWAYVMFLRNVVDRRRKKNVYELDLHQWLASMIYRHLTTVYILELLGLKIFKGLSLQRRNTLSTWKKQSWIGHQGKLKCRMHMMRAERSTVYEMLADAVISRDKVSLQQILARWGRPRQSTMERKALTAEKELQEEDTKPDNEDELRAEIKVTSKTIITIQKEHCKNDKAWGNTKVLLDCR